MKQKILIADDDTSLRRVLEYNLTAAGYEVTALSSGEEALAAFKGVSPDLVITDMKMPGMDGMQLLKKLKELSPEILVVMITAFGTVDVAVEAMKAGAYDYITKPFNRDELLLTVAKALQFTRMSAENRQLKSELSERSDYRLIIGSSPSMARVFQVIDKVSASDASVLITGESGTGKELAARAIHKQSQRSGAPFIAVNCAAIPRDLLESELFGHLKGAFTGAVKDKTGRFEQADGGTIFLDEIGELPIELQPKLLRVLQEREVEPVGGGKLKKLDIRVVAATNLDIDKALEEGRFREDLYYRIAVIQLHLPALRERPDDIPVLVRHFCERSGACAVRFDREAMKALTSYHWPGNVRELENVIERILIMRESDSITLGDIPAKMLKRDNSPLNQVVNLPVEGYPLEKLEREIVVEALRRNDWNQTAAARFLSVPRHTLIYRMEKYSISHGEVEKNI